ncbi:MAG: YgjV family protein [Clostridia bacterium]|nr:YgjV family protein [Clostridia bacterium]
MTPIEIAAQAVGTVALILTVLSFQCKTGKKIMTIQVVTCLLWSINLAMLQAFSGMALNLLALVCAFVFANRKLCHADHIAWPVAICTLSAAAYFLPFTVFRGTVYADATPATADYFWNLLPSIAMIVHTISFYIGSAKVIRGLNYINSPCWLLYDAFFAKNYVGAINEAITIISVTVAVIRYRKKANASENLAE